MPQDRSALSTTGRSSRLRRLPGARCHWRADNGCEVELPVILDLVQQDPETARVVWKVEATIDMVAGAPALTRLRLEAEEGIDTVYAQRFFRWATPLEIIRRTVPQLIARGIDPYSFSFATEGYPDSANLESRLGLTRLTDEFLEEIARQYLDIGRGYAKAIAAERNVSQRTVVSWIEKARERGILSVVNRGSVGGRIVPASKRKSRP